MLQYLQLLALVELRLGQMSQIQLIYPYLVDIPFINTGSNFKVLYHVQ